MRISKGFVDLTLREALTQMPRYTRRQRLAYWLLFPFAPLHDAWRRLFCGDTAWNQNMFQDMTVPDHPPRCNDCGEVVGQCDHTNGYYNYGERS